MDLLILKQRPNDELPQYRGVDGETPFYCEGLAEDHPANQAFFWFCSEWAQDGAVHDLDRARALVDIYRGLDPPQQFEILEATDVSPPRVAGSPFVGFDLAASYHYSLLEWGMEFGSDPGPELPEDDRYWVLVPLLRLIKKHFKPQLNPNGLFGDYETARFCLDCLMALQEIRPGLWENEDVEFEVVGLWRVSGST